MLKSKQLKKLTRYFSSITTLVFSLGFSSILMYKLTDAPGSSNLLIQYYKSIIQGPIWIPLLLLGAFIACTTIPLFALIKERKSVKTIFAKFGSLSARTMLLGFVGLNISILFTLIAIFVSYAQINNSLIKTPEKLGIVEGKEKISEVLKARSSPPAIATSTENILVPFVKSTVAKKSYLGEFATNKLLSILPVKMFPEPSLPDSNLVIVGDTLVICELMADEMKAIGPEMSRTMVASYFYPRNLKPSPELNVLSRQEYLKFRDDEINNKMAEIDQLIAGLNSKISGAKSQMTRIIMRYYYGELDIDSAVSQYKGQEGLVAKYQGEQSQLKKQKEFVKLQKGSTPYELGLFMPSEPNLIRVVLDTTKEDALNPFLVTLVHEHLHYASYVDNERILPTFFEEGLTEYFARKIVGDQFGVQAEVGYPVIVRVIQGFVKKVPEAKLADAYFNKDIEMLKSALNEAYGEKFYEESEFHFMMIPFSSSDDAIKFANDILSVIGEQEMKESDIK